MKLCCIHCFSDEYLRRFVQENGQSGNCQYCGTQKTTTISTAVIGDFVRDKLICAYTRSTSDVGPYDSEDKVYLWGDPTDGLYAWEILLSEECVLSSRAWTDDSVAEKLAQDLVMDSGPDSRDIAQGADDWLGGDALLVLRNKFFGPQDTGFHEGWHGLKERLQRARFFDCPSHGESRAEILRPVLDLIEQATITLDAGTSLWRARRIYDDRPPPVGELKATEIGPAPPRLTNGKRMSPPGISYMYLASDGDTACAEVAWEHVDSRVWLGEFNLRSELKILDLTGKTAAYAGSIFSPTYDHSLRWAPQIMHGFANEISKPIEGTQEELEYVPTQVLSEYVRLFAGVNGIAYKSAKRATAVNYVLFCGRAPDHPGSWTAAAAVPFSDWMELGQLQDIRSAPPSAPAGSL